MIRVVHCVVQIDDIVAGQFFTFILSSFILYRILIYFSVGYFIYLSLISKIADSHHRIRRNQRQQLTIACPTTCVDISRKVCLSKKIGRQGVFAHAHPRYRFGLLVQEFCLEIFVQKRLEWHCDVLVQGAWSLCITTYKSMFILTHFSPILLT